MGQAARKKRAYEDAKRSLLAELEPEGKTVAEVAIALFEGFVMPKRHTGGCYHLTMTLHRYLGEEFGIETTPVVGYVTDGTDDILISHAWLEHRGRKTDLTLALTDDDINLPGGLLVQDGVIRAGPLQYLYHPEETAEGVVVRNEMLKDPQVRALIVHKETEHAEMKKRVADPDLRDLYLGGAPADQTYEIMTAVLPKRRQLPTA